MLDRLCGAFYYRMLIRYAEIDDEWIRPLVLKAVRSVSPRVAPGR